MTSYILNNKIPVLLLLFFAGPAGCSHSNRQPQVIVVQPFEDVSNADTRLVYTTIAKVIPQVTMREPIPLPADAYVRARNRYRADSAIRLLGKRHGQDTTVIGITHYDISTAKGKHQDWGVMGLGYCPGNACIVSTFRLKKANLPEQLSKVALHELGHTQGLKHCNIPHCLMRDAEGGNPLDEEKDFCPDRKSVV